MSELLNKSVMKFYNIKDPPIIDITISDSIPELCFDNTKLDILNRYKNMINDVKNVKIWDFCKKLSNPYELLHH